MKERSKERIVAEQVQADLELVRAVLARDRKASADFVRFYTDQVHRYVWRRLAPRTELAEDLVQEIMLAAWSGLKNYTGEAPLAHWISAVARFKVSDYYRARLRAVEAVEDDSAAANVEDRAERPDLQVEKTLLAERAARILGQMREEYAVVLRWRYWEGFSAREMAADIGRSEKSIERTLARARREFERIWIAQEGGSR